jgi:hypothetical protein
MRAVCAWCRREGREGYLGNREPLSNPGETHGICARHQEAVLSTLAAPSFPQATLLVVVDANQRDLYDYLVTALRPVPGVQVLMDRRRGERRRGSGATGRERRVGDRRRRIGQRYDGLGVTLFRFKMRGVA